MRKVLFGAASALVLLAGSPASSTVMLATWTGTVTSGNDFGYFGLGTQQHAVQLAGAAYTAQFVFDTNVGHSTITGHSEERRGGTAYTFNGAHEPGPMIDARFTLNGRSVDLDDDSAGLAATGAGSYINLASPSGIALSPRYGQLILGTTGPDLSPALLTTEFARAITGSGNLQFNISNNGVVTGGYFLDLAASTLSVQVKPGEFERPILPNAPGVGTLPPAGGFGFDFDVFTSDEWDFVDPLVAAGYDYSVLSGQRILEALFPVVAGDTDGFQLYSSDGSTFLGTAFAGTAFHFGAGGVSGFQIRDIDGALDPGDGGAFRAGLRFSAPGHVSLTQTPFVVNTGGVPEPAGWALMIAGFGLAGAGLRRRAATA